MKHFILLALLTLSLGVLISSKENHISQGNNPMPLPALQIEIKMQVHIPSEQRLRVSTNGDRVFVDASSAPFQECLTVEFYSFQKQIIKSKDGTFKMFVFTKEQDPNDFDYGFWSDAKTVWQSF